MRITISAFEPFSGRQHNASQVALQRLMEQPVAGIDIVPVFVPVRDNAVDIKVREMLLDTPDVVLCLGESANASTVLLERVAINLKDYPEPDTAGNQYADVPIVEGGPDAYFSTLPLKLMAASAFAADVPVAFSNTAGTFLCNQLMYAVLAATAGTKTRAGFIHLPLLPQQVTLMTSRNPSMSVDETSRALRNCVRVLASGISAPIAV